MQAYVILILQCLIFSSGIAALTIIFAAFHEIHLTSSDSSLAAVFASSHAMSLPGISKWPGIYCTIISDLHLDSISRRGGGGALLHHTLQRLAVGLTVRADQDAHWILLRRLVGCTHEGLVFFFSRRSVRHSLRPDDLRLHWLLGASCCDDRGRSSPSASGVNTAVRVDQDVRLQVVDPSKRCSPFHRNVVASTLVA